MSAAITSGGFNCFGCQHRHEGKALAFTCVGCPCPFRYCEGCQTAIDPETCGCGNPVGGGGHEGHMIIPMGCGCYRHNAHYEAHLDPFAEKPDESQKPE